MRQLLRHWSRRLPSGAAWYAAALVPFVVAATRALARGWYPIGDAAQLYIRATDVFTPHHPWLGAASSASTSLGFQVSNPGPLYFDLVAPFARAFPPGPGAVLGVTAINVASLVLAGVAARRIGGVPFERWVLAAAAVLGWTLGSELLFDMFQAHALLFPFLAGCVLLTGVALGETWAWPWLALIATLILQTHVSYAYILPILVLAAVVQAIGAMRRTEWSPDREWRAPAGWTLGVLVVTWIQPVGEQLFGDGEGNITRLARAARGGEVALGLANAVKLTAAFVALPPWSGRQGFRSTIEPSGIEQTADGRQAVALAGMPPGWLAVGALVVTLGLLGLAWWWARRRELRVLAVLSALSLVGVVGAVVALSRLTVTPLGFAPHHSRWIIVIALFVYVTLAWAVGDAVAARTAARQGAAVALLAPAALVVVFSALNLGHYAQPHGPTADAAALPALEAAFGGIDAAIADGTLTGPVFFDLSNERVYAPHTSALQLHLRERGIEFRVDGEFMVRQLGERRRADGTEAVTLHQFHDTPTAEIPEAGCVIADVAPTGSEPGWPSRSFTVTLSGPGVSGRGACR